MKKHANIPIFIPHLGCPNDCVFCNQRIISGHMEFDENDVKKDIEAALFDIESTGEIEEIEIAFFGGSFTGIDRGLMIRLLECAYGYVESGRVHSIRLSTRPDYIDGEILSILKKYGVRTIELGLQSMDDQVLKATKRGHSALDGERACTLIKEQGFELVGQMMIGLPQSDLQKEIATAEKICAMGVDGARVYPTVVFFDTELCHMAERAEYTPLDNESAVRRCAEVLKVFNKNDVPCIRVGLCASENLSSTERVYGGANHSAIGELAMGEVFFDKMCEELEGMPDDGNDKSVVFYVPLGAISKAVGQKKRNINRIKDKYFVKKHIKSIKILEKNELLGYNIKMEFSNKEG